MIIKKHEVSKLLDDANSKNSISVNHNSKTEAFDDVYDSLAPLLGGGAALAVLAFVSEVMTWLYSHYSSAVAVEMHHG